MKDIQRKLSREITYDAYGPLGPLNINYSKDNNPNYLFFPIEISNDTLGKPLISLKGKTKSVIQRKLKLKSYKIFLSLSDDKPWAIAFVIITVN